jgi:hypothetical protein
MGGTFGRKTIIYMIVACIVAIGFVSQAQSSQKDEASPLYDFRAAQAAETFGLAPSGSANSDLEFGSVATVGLTVQSEAELTVQTKQPSRPTAYPRCGGTAVATCMGCRAATGKGCYGPPTTQTSWNCKPTSSGCTYSVPGC